MIPHHLLAPPPSHLLYLYLHHPHTGSADNLVYTLIEDRINRTGSSEAIPTLTLCLPTMTTLEVSATVPRAPLLCAEFPPISPSQGLGSYDRLFSLLHHQFLLSFNYYKYAPVTHILRKIP